MTHKHMMYSEMLHTLKDFPDCIRLDNALGCASLLLCNGTQPPVLMLVLLVTSLFVGTSPASSVAKLLWELACSGASLKQKH